MLKRFNLSLLNQKGISFFIQKYQSEPFQG
jgi:hypothetical protein